MVCPTVVSLWGTGLRNGLRNGFLVVMLGLRSVGLCCEDPEVFSWRRKGGL